MTTTQQLVLGNTYLLKRHFLNSEPALSVKSSLERIGRKICNTNNDFRQAFHKGNRFSYELLAWTYCITFFTLHIIFTELITNCDFSDDDTNFSLGGKGIESQTLTDLSSTYLLGCVRSSSKWLI